MEAKTRVQLQLGFFTIFFAVFLSSVLIHCGEAQLQVSSSANERSAMLDLRSSLGLRGKDWPIKTDTCQWTGVECNGEGRIIGLTISGLRRTRVGRSQPRFAVDSLANLTLLTRFNASGFALPGSIPDWFGQRFSALRVLDLRYASIIGPIPSSLGGLTRLQNLLLAGNELTGSIPASLSSLSELSILDLSRNSLTGSIPPEFSSLRNLTILDLSSNFFSGSIPSLLARISGLRFLNLSDNSLYGPIPAQLSELSQLVGLNLSKNSLSGSFPEEFVALRNLRVLDFGGNGLEGPLPRSLLSNLSQLRVLVLSGNRFDGNVSGEAWSLPSLKLFNISSNNFTGVLPGPGSNASANVDSVFDFSDNLLYGNLPKLSSGQFGSIDLTGNYFKGAAIESIGNVSLARNCLSIRFTSQRTSEDCRLFYAERGLVFEGFEGPLGETPPALSKPDSGRKNKLTFILVGVFGGIGFIAVLVLVLVVFLKCRGNGRTNMTNRRSVSNVGPAPEGSISSLRKEPLYLSGLGDSFTYDQIVQFTGNFTDANLIKHGHSGDIFRGYLEGGTPIVIKKVDLRSSKSDSYVMELEFFRKVSHPRLVPLLGYCLENDNEKFLVYKHMPNGDLASSLHRVAISGNDGFQSMDWITRLKIAIGAAEFLSYLHHECSPPLVHRDIQASSILLDDKFDVRLGSLSEVHVQEGDANQNVITRLLRKPQTSDQSSTATAPAICAHDVLCFGKVLLELVTGKLGISKNDDASTREWLENTLRHGNIYEKEFINKIVDPSLILDEDLLEEVWAMAIVARSCLNPKPSKRPLMKHILKALENPLKVVRVESLSSARLRTTSSRVSWTAAFFGSWRHSSSDNTRENTSSFKQTTRVGSQGSGGNEFSSSSNKRLSSEIFPEPVEGQDLERLAEH